MDIADEMQEIEVEEEISPIIRIFERLTFERSHEVHDQVSSMIELFSLSAVTLEMLDTLIECVKITLVDQHMNKNLRILDFLVALTHVTHLSYANNKNLSLIFDALIDILTQSMMAMDSQIRCITLRIVNKIQSFIDLSRSPYVPDQFAQYLLELLKNETNLHVLDEVIPLAAKFQHKNHQFIDAFLTRITSPKWSSYLARRRQIISCIEYSASSLQFLLSAIDADNDLSHVAFESLLADERGFTVDTIGSRGRSTIFRIASTSRDLSRLIFTRWISQSGNELVEILRLCQIASLGEDKTTNERSMIETSLRYFLNDGNIQRIVRSNMKKAIGANNGGVLSANISSYTEHLFIWRILCQLTNEEDEDDELNIHPDFHEFITYFYRVIKSSVNQTLTSAKQFVLCQHAGILATFEMLDIYRRKCLEAMGRCILVHFGQYEAIIEQAYQLVLRVHPSTDVSNERYHLITYTLNDVIQRCQTSQTEKLIFVQCMTIARVFIEREKQLALSNTDFKQLIDSLIKSGLSHHEMDIQAQTLPTLRSVMCYSRQAASQYIKQILQIIDATDNIALKCQSLSTFIDVLLIHGLDIFTSISLSDLTPSQFTTQYLLDLFDERNTELKILIVFGLMKLFLSSRCEPTAHLLKIILDYRFSNDHRSINQQQREEITSFFYFFVHLLPSNVRLMEDLTFDLVSRSLPFVSDNSTIAYQSILTEAMCSFCLELLSLPTLPIEEYPPYHLATNLLESIHQSTNHRTTFIIRSYLNTIKHLPFQYMNKEQLHNLLDLITQLRQYPNLPSIVASAIKHIEDQIQSSLKLIDRMPVGRNDEKRPRSPSLSSPPNAKRISSSFNPAITSSPNVLHDRTNQIVVHNSTARSTSKGVKRKLNPQRYSTLDFENDIDDYF